MANSLRQLDVRLSDQVGASAGYWTGDAGDAFRAWRPAHLGRPLQDEATAMDGMAGQLEQAAAQIDRANAEIHELEIEIAATLVLGGLLAIVTAGASAAAAGAADAAMAARAAMILDRLATILRVIATSACPGCSTWSPPAGPGCRCCRSPGARPSRRRRR